MLIWMGEKVRCINVQYADTGTNSEKVWIAIGEAAVGAKKKSYSLKLGCLTFCKHRFTWE